MAIPEPDKDKKPRDPPDFVRFYMGQLLMTCEHYYTDYTTRCVYRL